MDYWFGLKAKCKRRLPLCLTEYNFMKMLGEGRYGSTYSLPRHWMEVSVQLYATDQDRTVHEVGVWMRLRDSFGIL